MKKLKKVFDMQGKIAAKNHAKPLYAIEISDDEYIIFELMDSIALEIGHIISGPLNEVGSVVLKNDTTLVKFSAIIQKTKSDKINVFRVIG